MIKAIIFDYDGVIVDSFSTVFSVYQTICREMGVALPESEIKFRTLYHRSYWELYGDLGIKDDDKAKANQIFRREVVTKDPQLFVGLKELISELSQRFDLFIVSSNLILEIEEKVKKHGLSPYFKKIIGDIGSERFFKSDGIKSILEQENILPSEAVYIGDRTIDYIAAERAGLDLNHILLVDYGWGYDKNLIKVNYNIKKPQDLIKVINNLNV